MRCASLVVVVLILSASRGAAQEHTTDTSDQIKKALADKKAILIDVREQKEWDEGHLKDAGLAPLSKLSAAKKDEFEKLIPKGSIVYLHCKAGGRCVTAAAILKKQGYDARPIKDGYEDLLKAGFPKAEK